MRKKITLVLAALFLCGCSATKQSLEQRMTRALQQVEQLQMNVRADNNKALYSYYVEPSVGRRISTASANVFVMDGVEFVMNLNAAQIVSEHFYTEAAAQSPNLDNAEVVIEGQYTAADGSVQSYTATVSGRQGEQVLVTLATRYFTFEGVCSETAAPSLAAQMLKIVRTASYDEEEVLNSYSSKSRISYVKENLNLFEEEIPESGLLEELMSDKTQTDGGDEQIDADQSGETFEDGNASDSLPLNEEDGEAQGEQEPAAE